MRLNFFLSRKTTWFQYVMLNCLIITMALWGRSQALACTEMPKINPYEAKLRNITFEKGVTQKWCLKLSEPQHAALIEWSTVNKSNTSCGVLKLVVHLPDGTKLKSEGVQPGTVTNFKPGKYVMAYTMKTNEPKCKTWDLGVRW